MTDLATALASTPLSDFEGQPVIASGIEIPGAAGGLQPAMKIEPREFHQGDEVYVAFRLVVGKVRHEPIVKDEPLGALRRVHIFQVVGASIVDGGAVEEAITATALRIAKAKEDAAGVQRFDWEGDEAALAAEHEDGQHADLREGCPLCQAETDAEEAEAASDA